MQVFDDLLALALLSQKAGVLDDFVALMFTPEEHDQIKKRYLLIEALIKDEWPQRQISQDLAVSIAKITRGSNALKRIDPKLKKILQQFFAE